MRAVVQRSHDAAVVVDGARVGGFDGPGIVALVGVTHDDSAARAVRLADKIFDLRIFDGPTEQSACDLSLPLLIVSQFTLYADTRKGRRPTWDQAAPRAIAEPLVQAVVNRLVERGATVSTGAFGADMRVTLTNDGPMTLLLEVTS